MPFGVNSNDIVDLSCELKYFGESGVYFDVLAYAFLFVRVEVEDGFLALGSHPDHVFDAQVA